MAYKLAVKTGRALDKTDVGHRDRHRDSDHDTRDRKNRIKLEREVAA